MGSIARVTVEPPRIMPAPATAAPDRGIRIAVVNLTSGGMSGGYVKYLQAMVPLLRADRRIAQLELFMPMGLPAPDDGPVHRWSSSDWSSHAYLRSRLRALRPDVVFFPTARYVTSGGRPSVVMVRNMEPLRIPYGGNTMAESIRNLGRALAARSACRRATRVIAVSHHVRQFLLDRWRLPHDRVGVVYHGTDSAQHARRVPAGLPDDRPFVFAAGSIRPSRGLEDLIRAAPRLVARHPDLRIVIAGRSDDGRRRYETSLKRLASGLGVGDHLIWLGHVSKAELAWAFERCAAFVVTSRAEACPNLVLEAMSYGAPAVSTIQEPMPELFGEGALFYRPGDAEQLADRISTLAGSRGEAIARGRCAAERARFFTWRRAADETIQQLAAVAAAG